MSLSTIGRYIVERELGVGGMATVYLARDPYMKRQVAIKLLSQQMTADSLYYRFFQREAEVIAALEHPCIVPVFDFGLHGAQPYIVMRNMVGGSLQDRLKAGGKLELAQVSRIIGRVADGLDAAHARGVVHRDVKPSNILFDASDEAFLADFGIAKLMHQSTGETGGFVLGTPQYMSPEQITNSELDGRSDVYALGAVLFRSLAGRIPFSGSSGREIGKAHLTEPPPRVSDFRPDLQPAWDEIVSKAMAKQPADRYPRAGDLARDVHEVASGRWYFRKLAFD
jgi:serine/threonine protein kinase